MCTGPDGCGDLIAFAVLAALALVAVAVVTVWLLWRMIRRARRRRAGIVDAVAVDPDDSPDAVRSGRR